MTTKDCQAFRTFRGVIPPECFHKRRTTELEALVEEYKIICAQKQQTIEYLEGYVEFCKCKNPKADCVCPDANAELKNHYILSEPKT